MEQEQNDNVKVNPDEVLAPGDEGAKAPEDPDSDFISQPAKVMRIGSMVKSLLDEARSATLDEGGRACSFAGSGRRTRPDGAAL